MQPGVIRIYQNVIPACWNSRQEDSKFQASLDYTVKTFVKKKKKEASKHW
jgi:hypothetical protein